MLRAKWGLYATILVAGSGAQVHPLHPAPVQEPYYQQSSVSLNVSVSLGCFLPSLPIFFCLLLGLLLEAISPSPNLLPDALPQEQDLRAYTPPGLPLCP